MAKKPKQLLHGEGHVLAALERWCLKANPNTEAEAFMRHVRIEDGGVRTLDAVSMGMWRSRGFTVTGYEVKCSRSDWLRELRDPQKADALAKHCDYFYLVVNDPGIVHHGELPELWGMIHAKPRGCSVVEKAQALGDLTERSALPRPLVKSMLRSIFKAATAEVPALVNERMAEERERRSYADERRDEAIERLRGRERRFHKICGLSYREFLGAYDHEDPDAIRAAKVLPVIIEGDKDMRAVTDRIKWTLKQARGIAKEVDGLAEKYGLDVESDALRD